MLGRVESTPPWSLVNLEKPSPNRVKFIMIHKLSWVIILFYSASEEKVTEFYNNIEGLTSLPPNIIKDSGNESVAPLLMNACTSTSN